MATFYEKQREYAESHQVPFDEDDWDQMCGSLMHRFNTWLGWGKAPTGNVSSAFRVAKRSGWLNTDASKAPITAWHYFDIAGEGNGHVMQDGLGGGGTCLSTGWDLSESIGKAIGFQSVWGYVKAKAGRATYLGWAMLYADGTVNPKYLPTTTAGGNAAILPAPTPAPATPAPAPAPITEEDTMLYLATTTSDDELIQKGWRYKQSGSGPFCAVSNLETIALQAAKIFTASYNGNDIRLLAALYGFAEHEKLTGSNQSSNKIPLTGPGRLTGRVIFSNNAKPEWPSARIGI